MARKATIHRKTAETDVYIEMDLDGAGEGNLSTTVAFLDHMLNLLSRHGLLDLTVKSKGDTDIDDHCSSTPGPI